MLIRALKLCTPFSLQLGVGGDIGKEGVFQGVVVYAATIVSDAVAHNQVLHLQHHVVARNLVEHGLGNLDVGRLVFHNHSGA